MINKKYITFQMHTRNSLPPPDPFTISLFMDLVTCGQSRPENTKWKILEINNSLV